MLMHSVDIERDGFDGGQLGMTHKQIHVPRVPSACPMGRGVSTAAVLALAGSSQPRSLLRSSSADVSSALRRSRRQEVRSSQMETSPSEVEAALDTPRGPRFFRNFWSGVCCGLGSLTHACLCLAGGQARRRPLFASHGVPSVRFLGYATLFCFLLLARRRSLFDVAALRCTSVLDQMEAF